LLKKIIITLLIISLLLFTGCLDNSSNNKKNGTDGDYTEDFQFTLLNGSRINLSKFMGKIVVLDLFGVKCQPCQYQMMVLDQISNEYKDKDVEIVSIDVWIVFGETTELIEEFIDAYKEQVGIDLDWTFGVDDSSGVLFYKYVPADKGIPMLYILDKNGNIYYSSAGYTEYSVLAEKLDRLVK
jgi:thiol-disulfide isomerase/thioredoxin